ncbi:Uncharacterized protein OS=Stigmatella aurantiaca (strain DW4/3-1) GN=STAUR_0438 PE=4 SV=1 [Gemmata massiliana]|uniref:Uncharacterized protein n=1 Tax=Gemmata massiliana TaxID=1210884 RepID=A0A6P2CYS9_9BACT|nr:hypothetical protein [Gemmata massiliana]VTR93546.1 Uncharacterized protein OS=Stigmatella aurantiaca (strain DW4/3-1) GN=STAUR_0438 PE=4 SV=1 [Gemmata massiliana]
MPDEPMSWWRRNQNVIWTLVAVALAVAVVLALAAWGFPNAPDGGSTLQKTGVWVLGLMPGVLILQQFIHIQLHRALLVRGSRNEWSGSGPAPARPQSTGSANVGPMYESVAVVAEEDVRRAFSTPSIIGQYAGPFITVLIIGPVLAHIVAFGAWLDSEGRIFRTGIQYGALGAYVYVLLNLSRRYFHRDITSGSAMWAVVTLALGPVLGAAVCQVLENAGLESTGTAGATLPLPPWAFRGIAFLSGMAPRSVVTIVQEFFRRFLIRTTGGQNYTPRLVPLTQVRGITADIEDRLLEEGIEDAVGLAMANPYRLLRNTPFHERQILTWMDEAILMTTFPFNWQLFENEGITGAMDLVATDGPTLATLAELVKMKAPLLQAAHSRLKSNAQLVLVMVLFAKQAGQ